MEVNPFSVYKAAFEAHTGLLPEQYTVTQSELEITIDVGGEEGYLVSDYERISNEINYIIDKRMIDDIPCSTELDVWAAIYIDGGIRKSEFLPVLLSFWSSYWSTNDSDNRHKLLRQENKEHSWKKFQVFMECYEDADNIIELAAEIDDTIYGLAVFTMLAIFDKEVCILEYCERLFSLSFWTSIDANPGHEDSCTFYILTHPDAQPESAAE